MARAKIPDNLKAVPAHISLPYPMIQQLRKIATPQGKSLSGYVRELLLKELQKN